MYLKLILILYGEIVEVKMTKTKVKETTMKEEKLYWTKEEIESVPASYGCVLIKERATLEEQHNKKLPTDVYRIFYKVQDKIHCDMVRTSRKVDLFDMYYDKFGPGVIQKIDWGYGTINPKSWDYVSPEIKKKRSR